MTMGTGDAAIMRMRKEPEEDIDEERTENAPNLFLLEAIH